MRGSWAVAVALLLVVMSAGPASAQWIPPLSPGGAVLGPDPVFPGVAGAPAPGSPVNVPPPPLVPPSATPVTARLRVASAEAVPVIPDSTWTWLTYYGSPESPTFVPLAAFLIRTPVVSRPHPR